MKQCDTDGDGQISFGRVRQPLQEVPKYRLPGVLAGEPVWVDSQVGSDEGLRRYFSRTLYASPADPELRCVRRVTNYLNEFPATRRTSLSSKRAIPRVAEAGDDVSLVVQLLVDHGCVHTRARGTCQRGR